MQALYERMRPARESDLLGPARKASAALRRMARQRSQLAALILGPSGSGKSTLSELQARNLAGSDMDVIRYNLGSLRGVDFVRDLEDKITLAPWGPGWKVYLFEEAHNLTAQAQEALLHLTEHYPARRALVFTSTDGAAFTDSFRSRLLTVILPAFTRANLSRLVLKAAGLAGIRLAGGALDRIITTAAGNARTALNSLEWYGASGMLPELAPAVVSLAFTPGRAAALKAWETRRALATA